MVYVYIPEKRILLVWFIDSTVILYIQIRLLGGLFLLIHQVNIGAILLLLRYVTLAAPHPPS